MRVADDGPGGPFDAARDTGGPDLEALLTSIHAGPELSGRHITDVGQFRAGLFVANALSSRLTAEMRCEGGRRVQEYARGVAVAPPAAVGSATGSGTTIAFWPDTEIFETTRCSFAVLAERFRQVAFLNRGLGISLTDERPAGEAAGGAASGSRTECGTSWPPSTRRRGRPSLRTSSASSGEDPRMAGTMEVALLWSGSGQERILGFANSRATREGGTHLDGFRDGVAAAVIAYARERGVADSGTPTPATTGSAGPHGSRIGETRPSRIPRRHARVAGQHRGAGLRRGRPSGNTSATGSRNTRSGPRNSSTESLGGIASPDWLLFFRV